MACMLYKKEWSDILAIWLEDSSGHRTISMEQEETGNSTVWELSMTEATPNHPMASSLDSQTLILHQLINLLYLLGMVIPLVAWLTTILCIFTVCLQVAAAQGSCSILIPGPAFVDWHILLMPGGWAITDINSKLAYTHSVSSFPSNQKSWTRSSGSNHEFHMDKWQSLDSDLSLVVKAEHSCSIYVSYELHFSLAGCLLKMQSVTSWLIPGSIPVSASLYPDVVYQDSLLQNLTLTSCSWSHLSINSPRTWWPLSEWQSTRDPFRLELE